MNQVKPIRNSLFRPFAITFCDSEALASLRASGDLAEASKRAAYIAGDLNPQSSLNNS